MGCIETNLHTVMTLLLHRLTLTWDVLKRKNEESEQKLIQINFNMGCIETSSIQQRATQLKTINFNMGCIETQFLCMIYQCNCD